MPGNLYIFAPEGMKEYNISTDTLTILTDNTYWGTFDPPLTLSGATIQGSYTIPTGVTGVAPGMYIYATNYIIYYVDLENETLTQFSYIDNIVAPIFNGEYHKGFVYLSISGGASGRQLARINPLDGSVNLTFGSIGSSNFNVGSLFTYDNALYVIQSPFNDPCYRLEFTDDGTHLSTTNIGPLPVFLPPNRYFHADGATTVITFPETPPGEGTPPTVTNITLSDNELTLGDTALVTITFNEVVTGVVGGTVTADNATHTVPVSTDGGTTYTTTITPNAWGFQRH